MYIDIVLFHKDKEIQEIVTDQVIPSSCFPVLQDVAFLVLLELGHLCDLAHSRMQKEKYKRIRSLF